MKRAGFDVLQEGVTGLPLGTTGATGGLTPRAQDTVTAALELPEPDAHRRAAHAGLSV